MKISVVIPAYNEEAFLPHLLASLQAQTFPKQDYEVIVVDNNSTDKTAAIAKKFGARVISESKRGYAYACNAGFAAAKGEIIARADADYIQPKDWLEKIQKAFQKDPKIVALGGPLYPLESTFLENIIYYPAIVIWMNILKFLGDGFLFPNMAVRKPIYEKTGGFDTHLQFGEDTKMCLKLVKLGKVAYMPNLYVYTSIRKMRSLGLIQSIFGYSFGNHIAMWLGKEATVGLEVVRDIPLGKPKQYKPWIFLYAIPLSMVVLLLLLTSYFMPTETTQQVVKRTQKIAQMSDKALENRIQLIRNFNWSTIFPIQPLKEI
jgi:glycosyltransferase involved in cell wall biosynthesis